METLSAIDELSGFVLLFLSFVGHDPLADLQGVDAQQSLTQLAHEFRRETLIHRPPVSGDSSIAASAVPAWALAAENRSGRALLQENRPLMWRQMLDASPAWGETLSSSNKAQCTGDAQPITRAIEAGCREVFARLTRARSRAAGFLLRSPVEPFWSRGYRIHRRAAVRHTSWSKSHE